jgi:hypothetical protein
MRKQKRRRLGVTTDRLRILTPAETDEARGGDPPYTHCCQGHHPNCPNDTRYCL